MRSRLHELRLYKLGRKLLELRSRRANEKRLRRASRAPAARARPRSRVAPIRVRPSPLRDGAPLSPAIHSSATARVHTPGAPGLPKRAAHVRLAMPRSRHWRSSTARGRRLGLSTRCASPLTGGPNTSRADRGSSRDIRAATPFVHGARLCNFRDKGRRAIPCDPAQFSLHRGACRAGRANHRRTSFPLPCRAAIRSLLSFVSY